MTLNSIVALFSSMIVLAAIPSISVLAVSTRSATYGLIHGVFVTLGIVLGDIIFILIAIWGLTFLAEAMGSLFVVIKYLGSAYLIALGMGLCRATSTNPQVKDTISSSLFSSFMTGFLITLGDQKATLFYLGFFPAFLDVSKISLIDTLIIITVTIVAVGGVKLGYAVLADRARMLISSRINAGITTAAGLVVIGVGVFLLVTA